MANLLESLLTQAESNWNMGSKEIQDAMARIAFHESKYGTPEYTPIQISDKSPTGYGPGRGMYQYEIGDKQGAHTAINRIIAFNDKNKEKYDVSFLDPIIKNKSYDFSELTSDQQNMLFLADKLQDSTANMGKYDINKDRVLSDKELAGFHADEHWAGHSGDKQVRDDFIQKLIEDYQFYKP